MMKFIEMQVKKRSFLIRAEEWKNQIWFHLDGRIFILDKTGTTVRSGTTEATVRADTTGTTNTDLALSSRQTGKHANQQEVQSPMPGQIVKVLVKPGRKVVENQTLIVLSSMKMEYVLKSDRKGVVQSVHVQEGETVSGNQILVKISG